MQSSNDDIQLSIAQMCIVTLWPSFLVAILACGLFFSAFNPRDLYPYDLDLEINIVGAYTLGFFLFWILCALSSAITLYFAITNCRKIHADNTQTS